MAVFIENFLFTLSKIRICRKTSRRVKPATYTSFTWSYRRENYEPNSIHCFLMWLHKTSCLYDIKYNEGPRAGQARCGIVDMLAISPYFVSIACCLGHRTNEKTESGFVFHCFCRSEAAAIIIYSTRYNWHEQLVVKRQ